MRTDISIPQKQLAAFCRKHRIRRLALFGSVLRNDFRPESDVDVLVEFEADVRIGLEFFEIEHELSQLLGRRVDLHTPGFLGKSFRDEVLTEAELLYDAAK